MKSYDHKLLEKIRRAKEIRKEIEDKGERGIEPNLRSISDALDEYYFINKLRIYCAYLSYASIVNPDTLGYKEDSLLLIDQITKKKHNNRFNNPLFFIYNGIREIYQKIELHDEKMDDLMDEILNLVKENSHQYSNEEILEIYSLLSSCCVKKVNLNSPGYVERFFLINNEMINCKFKKKTYKSELLQSSVFENMIIVALNIKNDHLFKTIMTSGISPDDKKLGFKNSFEWVEKFIKHYKDKLDEKGKKYHYLYCLALLEFHRSNFVKAYRVLHNLQPRGFFIALNVKLLYLKILYEIYTTKPIILDNDDLEIEKVMEAYRSLIRDEITRKKQISYQIDFYLVFGKLFKKLIKFFDTYHSFRNKRSQIFLKNKELLKKEIDEINYPYKEWLLQKLNEIE